MYLLNVLNCFSWRCGIAFAIHMFVPTLKHTLFSAELSACIVFCSLYRHSNDFLLLWSLFLKIFWYPASNTCYT